MLQDVKSGIKVTCIDNELPFGEGAAGICQWMVEVKIAQNQVRVGERRKNPFGRCGGVRRTICAKKVHRSDSEGVVGESKKFLGRKNIN